MKYEVETGVIEGERVAVLKKDGKNWKAFSLDDAQRLFPNEPITLEHKMIKDFIERHEEK